MKATTSLLLFCSMASLFALTNCGGSSSNPEPIADQQFTKLAKTWKISTPANSVTLGGNDRTTEYASMTLTLSGTKRSSPFNYSVAGRPALSPWPASGKWEFNGTTSTQISTQIMRDKGTADELAVSYTVDGNNLQLSFNFSNPNGGYPGRVNVVAGQWVFNFTAQ